MDTAGLEEVILQQLQLIRELKAQYDQDQAWIKEPQELFMEIAPSLPLSHLSAVNLLLHPPQNDSRLSPKTGGDFWGGHIQLVSPSGRTGEGQARAEQRQGRTVGEALKPEEPVMLGAIGVVNHEECEPEHSTEGSQENLYLREQDSLATLQELQQEELESETREKDAVKAEKSSSAKIRRAERKRAQRTAAARQHNTEVCADTLLSDETSSAETLPPPSCSAETLPSFLNGSERLSSLLDSDTEQPSSLLDGNTGQPPAFPSGDGQPPAFPSGDGQPPALPSGTEQPCSNYRLQRDCNIKGHSPKPHTATQAHRPVQFLNSASFQQARVSSPIPPVSTEWHSGSAIRWGVHYGSHSPGAGPPDPHNLMDTRLFNGHYTTSTV